MVGLHRGVTLEISSQLSSEAAQIFAQWIGCYGVIWNCKVAENRERYKNYLETKKNNPDILWPKIGQGTSHFLTKDKPWLKQVPSQIRRNAGTKYVEAFNAFFKGLRSVPKFKHKSSKRNCLVTNELFEVKLIGDIIELNFKRTNKATAFFNLTIPRPESLTEVPKTIWLARQGERYWLSYSYVQATKELRAAHEIVDSIKNATPKFQQQKVIGLDVGVVRPCSLSTGDVLGFTQEEQNALQRKNKRRLKYQRILSRKKEIAKKNDTQVSNNYKKIQEQFSKKHAEIANTRKTMAHRVSKQISEKLVDIIVCEKLQIISMTKRPKAKKDPETGKWDVNGASRKAGLNKSILNISWGRILDYTAYKLRERDKLLIKVPAHYSSQECSECGYISAENRKSQEFFCCQQCGHSANADHNASCVLKNRFLKSLNAGTFVLTAKTVKKIALRKSKAVKTMVSACGADVKPISIGSGYEAGTFMSDRESSPALAAQ